MIWKPPNKNTPRQFAAAGGREDRPDNSSGAARDSRSFLRLIRLCRLRRFESHTDPAVSIAATRAILGMEAGR